MAYTPTTEEGKVMLKDGADPSVIEKMESEGGELYKDPAEHVEKTPEELAAEKEAKDKKDKADKEAGEGGGGGEGGEDDEEAEKGEGDDKGRKPPNRTPESMPAWKHKEELKKQREALEKEFEAKLSPLQKKILDLESKPGGATDSEIDKLAEHFNLKPEVASSLVDRMAEIIEKRTGLSGIKTDIEARKEQDRKSKEDAEYQNEWRNAVTQEALKAAANGKEITAEVEKKVRELAYTTTYARYALADIVRLKANELFPDRSERRPAEGGRGGSGRGPVTKSITEMSSEEIDNLSDEEFLKISDDLGKKGSKFTKKAAKR